MTKRTGATVITPRFRYAFKARIIEAGYKIMGEFSEALGVKLSRISTIIQGWEIPGPSLQRKLAQKLGISLRELKGLIE